MGRDRLGAVGRCITGAALVTALTLSGCFGARPPARDRAAERRRDNDQFWAYLAGSYDADHDGRIAPAEYDRTDAGFARLDRDGDDLVTRADLDRPVVAPPDLVLPFLLVRAFSGPDADSIACTDVAAGLARLDTNGDGRVGRAEFDARLPPDAEMDRFGVLVAGIDDDGDQLLSLPEIEAWCARRDTDGDGLLVRRERNAPGPAPATGWIEPDQRAPAPDFTATFPDANVATAWTLAAFAGIRPVALIFGSFT